MIYNYQKYGAHAVLFVVAIFSLSLESFAQDTSWRSSWRSFLGETLDVAFPDLHQHPGLLQLLDNYDPLYRKRLLDDDWAVKKLIEEYRNIEDIYVRHPELHPQVNPPIERDSYDKQALRKRVEKRAIADGKDELYQMVERIRDSGRMTDQLDEQARYLSELWGSDVRVDQVYKGLPQEQAAKLAGTFRRIGDINGDGHVTMIDLFLFRIEFSYRELLSAWQSLQTMVSELPPLVAPTGEDKDTRRSCGNVVEAYDGVQIANSLPLLTSSLDAGKDTKIQNAARKVAYNLLVNIQAQEAHSLWSLLEPRHVDAARGLVGAFGFLAKEHLRPEPQEQTMLVSRFDDKPATPAFTQSLVNVYQPVADALATNPADDASFWDRLPVHPFEEQAAELYQTTIVAASAVEAERWQQLSAVLWQQQPSRLGPLLEPLLQERFVARLDETATTAYERFVRSDLGNESKLVRWVNTGLWLRPAAMLVFNRFNYSWSNFRQDYSARNSTDGIGWTPQYRIRHRHMLSGAVDKRHLEPNSAIDAFGTFVDLLASVTTIWDKDDLLLLRPRTWRENYLDHPNRLTTELASRTLATSKPFQFVFVDSALQPDRYFLKRVMFSYRGPNLPVDPVIAEFRTWVEGYRAILRTEVDRRWHAFREARKAEFMPLTRKAARWEAELARFWDLCHSRAEERGDQIGKDIEMDALLSPEEFERFNQCEERCDEIEEEIYDFDQEFWQSDETLPVGEMLTMYKLHHNLPDSWSVEDEDKYADEILDGLDKSIPPGVMAHFLRDLDTLVFLSYFDLNLDGWVDNDDLQLFKQIAPSVDYDNLL